MLHFITKLTDPLIAYLKDDPVRPEIPAEFRVSDTTEILAIVTDGKPKAMVCVAYRDFVPQDCDELFIEPVNPIVAVFYTIWSYDPGAGRELIQRAKSELMIRNPSISKFVTLSPQTEMAQRFHTKNGATVYRNNATSVNYEYA